MLVRMQLAGCGPGVLCPAWLARRLPAGVGDTVLLASSAEPSPTYYEFVGVSGCQDVLHLYRLLWASAVLNVLGVLLGIVTAAVLGAFKDMVSRALWCWPCQQVGASGPASSEVGKAGLLSSLTKGKRRLMTTASHLLGHL